MEVFPILCWALFLIAAVLLWFVPVGALLTQAGGMTLFWSPDVLAVVRVTVEQASLSAAISTVLGVGLGLWVGQTQSSRLREICEMLLALPFVIPTVVVSSAWVFWLGRKGILPGLDWLYSLKAIVLAHVFLNAPWVGLQVSQARSQLPRPILDAAASLGASRSQRLAWIYWSMLSPAILAAFVQVFCLCATSFAIVLLLGGGPPVETLETALYASLRFSTPDWDRAIGVASWQLLIAALPWAWVATRRVRVSWSAPAAAEERVAPGARILVLAACALWCLPYLVLLDPGLLRDGFSRLGALELFHSIGVTLRIAVCSAGIAVTVGLAGVLALSAASHGPQRLGLALVGAIGGLSAMLLGVGVWRAYEQWLDPLDGSLTAMIAVQVGLFLPLVFRALWPLAQTRSKAELEAAATMGAGAFQTFWWVEWPRWRPAIGSAVALVAGASVGEVAAVSLFYSERLVPLPMWVARLLGQYRFAEAQTVSAMLLVLAILLAGISMRLRRLPG